jgi:hypothetical protein
VSRGLGDPAPIPLPVPDDPGPVPDAYEIPEITVQTVEAHVWTRVMQHDAIPLWVFNGADRIGVITVDLTRGTIGLPSGDGYRWMIKAGEHPHDTGEGISMRDIIWV